MPKRYYRIVVRSTDETDEYNDTTGACDKVLNEMMESTGMPPIAIVTAALLLLKIYKDNK